MSGQALRLKLYADQRKRCYYCRRKMNRSPGAMRWGNSRALTLDHMIPRAMGGQVRIWNCVAACAQCNSDKGDKLVVMG